MRGFGLGALALLALVGCKKSNKAAGGASAVDAALGAGAAPRQVDAGSSGPRDAGASVIPDAGPAAPAGDAGLVHRFDGRPGFLVISDDFDKHLRGLRRVEELAAQGVPATVVQTRLFENLTPGLFVVVVGRFDDEASAQALASQLSSKLPKIRVKASGAITGGPDPTVPDAGAPGGAPGQRLARLIHVTGQASHEGAKSLTLHVTMPDGRFDTRPSTQGEYEFWVASTGEVRIEMSARGVKELPEPCSEPGAESMWKGEDEPVAATITASSAPELRMDDLAVTLEAYPCD